jgi:hypothetical protein
LKGYEGLTSHVANRKNVINLVEGRVFCARALASILRTEKGDRMRADEILADKVNETEVNGVVIRKGSVGAFLANAKIFADPNASAEARSIAERDIVEGLPALRALGFFDILIVRDEQLRAFIETH